MEDLPALFESIDQMHDTEGMPILHENIKSYTMEKHDWAAEKFDELLTLALDNGLLKQYNLRDKLAYRRNYRKNNAIIHDPVEEVYTQTDTDSAILTSEYLEFKKHVTDEIAQLSTKLEKLSDISDRSGTQRVTGTPHAQLSSSANYQYPDLVIEEMRARINSLENIVKNQAATIISQNELLHKLATSSSPHPQTHQTTTVTPLTHHGRQNQAHHNR